MIGGNTTVAAVIGDPVRHSLSPVIHNAGFAASGLDWVYVALPVAAGHAAAAVDAMRTLGLGGMSVTMPHKDAVVAAADERSDAVTALGAANCLVRLADGRVRAENTDGAGFLFGLEVDAGFDVRGRSVVVIGAGGAGRAVVHSIAGAGASVVTVVNRSTERAAVAVGLAGSVGRVGTAADVANADLVVNATSVGMGGDRAMPCDPALIRPGQLVVDLVYEPVETPWLAALRSSGVVAHNGLSMLVGQAAVAFTLWTGVDAPIGTMREVIDNKFS